MIRNFSYFSFTIYKKFSIFLIRLRQKNKHSGKVTMISSSTDILLKTLESLKLNIG